MSAPQMSDDERHRMSGASSQSLLSEQDQLLIVLTSALHRWCRAWLADKIQRAWVNCVLDISEMDKLFVPLSWEPANMAIMGKCGKKHAKLLHRITSYYICNHWCNRTLYCGVPASLSLQSQWYLSYKSHTMMKGLTAIVPNGAFIFISTLYSDQELTIKSEFF